VYPKHHPLLLPVGLKRKLCRYPQVILLVIPYRNFFYCLVPSSPCRQRMGSRFQIERTGGSSPNLAPGCKSLGQFESEWAPPIESPRRISNEHKQRGGQSNHGIIVEPGQDLTQIPVRHPQSIRRRKSWSSP
jgi:hypothetical protein